MLRVIHIAFRAVSLFFIAMLTLSAIAFGVFLYLNAPPRSTMATAIEKKIDGVTFEDSGSISFTLQAGESASSAGKRLREARLIRSSLLWTLIARLDTGQIKAGTYRIEPPLSMLDIRELLVSGKQLLIRVTVPEGFTLKKTAELLESNGICSAADFLETTTSPAILRDYGIPSTTMEGYLYPDTYFFPKNYPAENVARTMADTFFRKIDEIYPSAKSLSSSELFERIVVASIVEREYRAVDEAPLMASVFYNRLKIGMALQSCATVEYVITERQGRPHPDVLYNRDIAISDPYNTYIHAGLPPGAISAPGLVALDAAFNPEKSNFLYFRLVDPAEGRHRFSKTLNEHVNAGIFYLKRGNASS